VSTAKEPLKKRAWKVKEWGERNTLSCKTNRHCPNVSHLNGLSPLVQYQSWTLMWLHYIGRDQAKQIIH